MVPAVPDGAVPRHVLGEGLVVHPRAGTIQGGRRRRRADGDEADDEHGGNHARAVEPVREEEGAEQQREDRPGEERALRRATDHRDGVERAEGDHRCGRRPRRAPRLTGPEPLQHGDRRQRGPAKQERAPHEHVGAAVGHERAGQRGEAVHHRPHELLPARRQQQAGRDLGTEQRDDEQRQRRAASAALRRLRRGIAPAAARHAPQAVAATAVRTARPCGAGASMSDHASSPSSARPRNAASRGSTATSAGADAGRARPGAAAATAITRPSPWPRAWCGRAGGGDRRADSRCTRRR